MAESTVASAVQWIGSLLIQEANILFDVADQVRGLQQELELMQAYLQDADAKQEKGEIGVLIRRVRELAYDAEDVIDMYVLNIQAKAEESYGSWITSFACFMCSAPEIYEVGKKIKEKQDEVKRFAETLKRNELRRIPELLEGFRLPRDRDYYKVPRRRSYHYEDNFEYVVGLEKDIQKLLLEVFMDKGNTNIKVLYIVGMGGSGKTTLARKIYNHPYVKKCFLNSMAWVSISQEWDTSHVLTQILRKVGGLNSNVDDVTDELHNILKEKPYLVVLDDVWRREALEQILPALQQGSSNTGSKIIITTRNRSIIQSQRRQENLHIHEPRPLSEEEGWELLSNLTLSNRRNCRAESFARVGKEMLKKCGGLPLAIVALAGILNTRESIGEWQQVNEAVRSRVMEGTQAETCTSVHDLLALSYEDLPYRLKPCFLYLCVFPEGHQFPAGMLTRMWIAEGLIAAHGDMSVEDVAEQYLEELSHRFMIQVVHTNFKGAIKAFHLHELLRDLCVRKANEQSFLQIYAGTHDQSTTNASTIAIHPRRAVLHSR